MGSSYIKQIKEAFPVDIGSTTILQLSSIKESTRVYRVDTKASALIGEALGDCYIIDTPQGRRIASHPHLVGAALSNLAFEAGTEFTHIIKELGYNEGSVGLLHILRGSSGYMIHHCLPDLPLIRVRTVYTETGYRDHSGDSRRIEVSYSDFTSDGPETLIIPDTYATGRSVEAALKHLHDQGYYPKTIIIYGFIAIQSIITLKKLCDENSCKLVTFAICDLTQLAANNYDMTLYGFDEHHHSDTSELALLGSVVGEETLADMAEMFIPGLDQPGDWSERHESLFNGSGEESGDIKGHLTKSIKFIESLDKINRAQTWYNDHISRLTQTEIESLRRVFEEY